MHIGEEEHQETRSTLLTVRGDFWGGDEWKLHEKVKSLVEQGKTRLVVDLTHVARMNSQGIGSLVSCLTTLKDADGVMKIAGANANISSHLDLLKLYTVLEAYPTSAEALASFG